MKVGHRYRDWRHFQKPKPNPRAFTPKFLCPSCRKLFNRPLAGDPLERPCPHCGGTAQRVGRNFRPPPLNATRRWKIMLYLLENGFRFPRGWPIPHTMTRARQMVDRNDFKTLKVVLSRYF